MDTKVCSTCGQEKSVDAFRKYYGGRKGSYSYCKECERIEQRRKYLVRRLEKLTDSETTELQHIKELYDRREAAGLKVLGKIRNTTGVSDIVDKHLEALR